jgi:microcystin degradation protein MlrC
VKALRVVPWSLSAPGEPPAENATAVVETGGIEVILTQRRTPFHRIADFTALGIDPHRCQVVVVKIGYLEPELKALAARSLLALSPGAVDQDITALPFQKLTRPMFPFDPQMEWAPK